LYRQPDITRRKTKKHSITNMPCIRKILASLMVVVSVFISGGHSLQAQTGSGDFTFGNELMRQGKFEEAFEIFERMLRENPRSYAIYDRAVTALINLKRYDDAIEMTKQRLGRVGDDSNTQIKLGEIYDISDRREQALDTWNSLLREHAGNAQVYRRVAETMNQRRLFREAIGVYEEARKQLGDANLFAFEIANNYLAVADFEPAMEEYLDIIARDGRRASLIQRQLLNYDERLLYDTAILLTEERLGQLTAGSDTDITYRDFLIWVTMERGLYRRALAAARTLERHSNNEHHAMFRIGRELRTRNEYELAEQAFRYYLELETHPLQSRSLEELSRIYQDWAGYLADRNLDFDGAADTLYRKAFETVEVLTERYPRYDRLIQTLVIQSELALDHLKTPDKAVFYHQKIERAARNDAEKALAHYVEGRLLLFEGNFSMARVSFTRSNRIAGSGEIADKSRYYLGLGDFYNGDFTYARIQLRSLERHSHSWYANNALELRYMIQEGHSDEGENPELKRYAHARYLYDTGRYAEAAEKLAAVLSEPAGHTLHGESMLLLARTLRRLNPELAFHVVDRHTRRPSIRNQAGERLLWERARLAETVYARQQRISESSGSADGLIPPEILSFSPTAEERFYGRGENSVRTLLNSEQVTWYYEELLLNYPDGYYSDIARNRIRDLERTVREI
jgi:tetratricopeptide (TPR) repeat protein